MTKEIVLFQGEKQELNFTITNLAGNPVDLTNAVVHFIVKSNLNDSSETPKINESVNDGNNVGEVSFTITKENNNITPRLYWYEVYVTFNDGAEYSAEIGRYWIRERAKQ